MKELHIMLASLVVAKGEWFQKKHGSWYKLQITEDFFMVLDTWSGFLCLKSGSGKYCQWVGFHGKLRINFGLRFGEYMANISETYYKYFIERIERMP